MPYTQEELKESTFYQQLIDRDEQEYLQRRALLLERAAASGSADDGALLYKDREGNILLFEDPYTGQLYDDETTILYVSRIVDQLKDDDSINGVINRDIREL